jgi:hypothetical protein
MSEQGTVTGLTNGTSYTFTVRAHNANGDGPESQPSNAIIPQIIIPGLQVLKCCYDGINWRDSNVSMCLDGSTWENV